MRGRRARDGDRRRSGLALDRTRLLADERALTEFPAPGAAVRGVLLYPERYHLGMSNLAVHTLLALLSTGGISCERAFLPDTADLAALQATGRPMLSLESATPLSTFDFIAITCQ